MFIVVSWTLWSQRFLRISTKHILNTSVSHMYTKIRYKDQVHVYTVEPAPLYTCECGIVNLVKMNFCDCCVQGLVRRGRLTPPRETLPPRL